MAVSRVQLKTEGGSDVQDMENQFKRVGGWGALAVNQGHQFVVQSRQEFRWQGGPLAASFITSLKVKEGTTLQSMMNTKLSKQRF